MNVQLLNARAGVSMPVFLKRVFLLSTCLAIASAMPASADTDIAVGIYSFPPVASVNQRKEVEGLVGELFTELKRLHAGLSFQILHTSPKRRHMDFEAGLYDVMFFENPDWGWQDQPVETSRPLLQDQEFYVALKKPGRDQSFFDNVADRNIVAISGYHHGFAESITDNDELQAKFNLEFSHSVRRNLDLIKADRPSVADVTVVSRSFLKTYFSRFPDQRELFLISNKVDQSYELRVIARRQGPVNINQLESLLQPLIESGRFQELAKKHGLQLPSNIAGAD
jgi:hypothetical protein